jgi:CheY-like chemotaxis protein
MSEKPEKTILLIEDEAELRQITREHLVQNGYIVLECSGLPQAKRILSRHAAIIDHVLCDNHLKGHAHAGEIIQRICETQNLRCTIITSDKKNAPSFAFEKPIHWPSLIQWIEGS